MSKIVQIKYSRDSNGEVVKIYRDEATAMMAVGFIVDDSFHPEADLIIYRGYTIQREDDYPKDSKYLNRWEANRKTLNITEYYDTISDLSIPTKFINELNDDQINRIVLNEGWEKAFVKNNIMSLFPIAYEASIWPITKANEMQIWYDKFSQKGPYAIRKYIENIEIFYDEQRYWVLDSTPYHPSGYIPDKIAEAAKRMYKFSGSRYFTIDMAGDYIVEVNPGESSDRGGDNPLDFFCEIFAKAFLK